VSVKTGPVDDDVREQYERMQETFAKAGEVIEGLISNKPYHHQEDVVGFCGDYRHPWGCLDDNDDDAVGTPMEKP
jgi:hypothetical protein